MQYISETYIYTFASPDDFRTHTLCLAANFSNGTFTSVHAPAVRAVDESPLCVKFAVAPQIYATK